ncbi:MAG: TIM-barrel domain-containing protein [Bifidobacterium adolescentis]
MHYLDSARNDGSDYSERNPRPLTFSRYAGPGSHRYPVGFSGDTVVTWESLKFQPEFTATRFQHRLRLVEPRHRRPHVRLP